MAPSVESKCLRWPRGGVKGRILRDLQERQTSAPRVGDSFAGADPKAADRWFAV